MKKQGIAAIAYLVFSLWFGYEMASCYKTSKYKEYRAVLHGGTPSEIRSDEWYLERKMSDENAACFGIFILAPIWIPPVIVGIIIVSGVDFIANGIPVKAQ